MCKRLFGFLAKGLRVYLDPEEHTYLSQDLCTEIMVPLLEPNSGRTGALNIQGPLRNLEEGFGGLGFQL